MNRQEIKKILQENEYGYIPAKPLRFTANKVSEDERFCAGKAVLERIELTATTEKGDVAFPFWFCKPKNDKQAKALVFLSFNPPEVPNKYLPAEEIIDRGWAFASLCYHDVSQDNEDFSDKAAPILRGEGPFAAGKIAMWAWGAMRVMDYLQTREDVDKTKIGVAGHSRLGKTALVTAAFDERFAFCHSNDSGTSGAALFSMRNKESESINDIVTRFSFWFCPNFAQYVDKETCMPFDQDELLSLIAPRVLSVASAEEDLWANPKAEFACAKKASAEWERYGVKGLVSPVEPQVGESYYEGNVSYYVRKRLHYMSREDWNRMLDFFDRKIGSK